MLLVCSLALFLLSSLPLTADGFKCYQCNTTWEMGCYYAWNEPPPSGVDPKHLKECTKFGNAEDVYCLKETYKPPKMHYGYNPFVNRTCGRGPVMSEDGKSEIFQANENGCKRWMSVTKVGKKTYELEKTLCKCDEDGCNGATSHFIFLSKNTCYFMALLIVYFKFA